MCPNNLVIISPNLCHNTSALGSTTYKAPSTIGVQPTSAKYNRQQLMAIKDMVKLDTRYSKIPFETINLVRKYKINKRPSKLDLYRKPIKQRKINTINLTKIETTQETITNKLRIATINIRSIKNKVELVIENSELETIDILAITETWLTNSPEDNAWVQTSGLEDQDYSFHMHNRTGRRGGGLGLQHRK